MPYACPSCHETIDHLHYNMQITQYGTEEGTYYWNTDNPDNGNYNNHETEIDDSESGDVTFHCPECEEEIGLDDLIEVNDNGEEEEEENDESPHTDSIIMPTTSCLIEITCPKCHFQQIIRHPSHNLPTKARCNKCNYLMTTEENCIKEVTTIGLEPLK